MSEFRPKADGYSTIGLSREQLEALERPGAITGERHRREAEQAERDAAKQAAREAEQQAEAEANLAVRAEIETTLRERFLNQPGVVEADWLKVKDDLLANHFADEAGRRDDEARARLARMYRSG